MCPIFTFFEVSPQRDLRLLENTLKKIKTQMRTRPHDFIAACSLQVLVRAETIIPGFTVDKYKDRMCFTTPQSYMAAQGGVVRLTIVV